MRNRLFPTEKPEMIDTARSEGGRKADNVLMDAFAAWQALDEFRRNADRNKRYVFGDQWGDTIIYEGKRMSERESIRRQGNVPITNNRLRSILNSVTGVFQGNQTEPVCIARERGGQEEGEIMTATLQYVYQLNKVWSLDVANLNNFMISGLSSCKSVFGEKRGKIDVWNENINYSRFFFDNHMEDIRQWDCQMVGEIEDMSLYDVMARFSNGSRDKADKIRQIYSYVNSERITSMMNAYTRDTRGYRDFFIADDDTQCRVITVWRKEAKERLLVHDTLNGDYYKVEISDEDNIKIENERRILEQSENGVLPEDMKLINYKWTVDNYWYYYHLSPTGDVLMEGESPYWHKEHPYSFKLYTFYDKQVFPFVSGFLDQQRYINRLIMMQDFMMRASAKGVLMVPLQALEGTGKTPEQFADDYVKFNGVVLYNAKPGIPIPQQITANSTQLGVYDMLSIQLKMLEDVSGVQGALQGKAPNSGTPASLYAQQTQNASTTLSEMFDFYRMYREERDTKNLQVVQQFYDTQRYINVSGIKNPIVYDPKKVQNVVFDLSIVESTSSPAYRMVINDMLMNLLNGGHITIKELLENGTFPFADKLLQSINGREEQMAQGGQVDLNTMQAIPPEVQSQIMRQANPNVMNMYNQMMSGAA
ncbi:MAG: hypothetical protein LBV72_00610 [Tannerella sp.]|nr:hypothetical protein [Tannerella sp.]